ncbi:MAG: hypothetical protein EAZ89_19565 [Bacteroidetes bacterium]|nr:MAG: hypothetical protein EAZ89_19565 [Bacteroidota bacterium]
MINRYPLLFRALMLSGCLLAGSALLFPEAVQQISPGFALVLILGIGLPHGATDHLIFRKLAKPLWGSRDWLRFYTRYIGLMGLYGIVWWIFPLPALAVFLALSVYHFGQCNWAFAHKMTLPAARTGAVLWGAFAVGMPILLHFDEARPIISGILHRETAPLADSLAYVAAGLLCALNTGFVLWQRRSGTLSLRETTGELLTLATLSALYLCTPMMMGFALFFGGWHALSSVSDQVQFFRQSHPDYTIADYLKQTLPLSLLALAGLAVLMGSTYFPSMLSALFVFISIITLPHMVIMEQLYQELGNTSPLKAP